MECIDLLEKRLAWYNHYARRPHLVIGAVNLSSMSVQSTIRLRQVGPKQIVALLDLRNQGTQLPNHPLVGALQLGYIHDLISD